MKLDVLGLILYVLTKWDALFWIAYDFLKAVLTFQKAAVHWQSMKRLRNEKVKKRTEQSMKEKR
jgi:hypothetical protein